MNITTSSARTALVRDIPENRLPNRFAPVWRANELTGTLQRIRMKPYPLQNNALKLARVLLVSLQHSRLFNQDDMRPPPSRQSRHVIDSGVLK